MVIYFAFEEAVVEMKEDGAALVGVKRGCRGEEKIVVGLMVMMFVRL